MIRSKAKAVTIVATIFVAGLACYSKAQEAKDSTIHKQDIVVEALQGLDYPSLPRLARASGRVVVRVELDEAQPHERAPRPHERPDEGKQNHRPERRADDGRRAQCSTCSVSRSSRERL